MLFRSHGVLAYLSGFAETCECREGWVVMPNGRYFDRTDSLKWPLYSIPHVRVIYYPTFLDETKSIEVEDDPLLSDLGVFASMAIPGEIEKSLPSISEMPRPEEWEEKGES